MKADEPTPWCVKVLQLPELCHAMVLTHQSLNLFQRTLKFISLNRFAFAQSKRIFIYILPYLCLHSDVGEDVESLSQFSTELVVEATARCLKVINSDLDLPHKLPPSMSAKFRVGTSLATAVQVRLAFDHV